MAKRRKDPKLFEPEATSLFEPEAKRHGKIILSIVLGLYLLSLIICLIAEALRSADWVVVAGSFWLGALLGLLLGFFVQEAPKWDKKALIASATAVAGSGVLLLLRYLVGVDEIWFYPLGLVGGFIIGTIWEYADPP